MSKVILTHEVTGLGTAGDVVEVKNGYARNYLVPQGFAVAWTRGGEKQVEQIKAARAAREHALARRGAGPQGQARVDQGQAGRQGGPGRPPLRLGEDLGRRGCGRGGRPRRRSTSARSRSPRPSRPSATHEATVRLRDDALGDDHPPGGRGEVARQHDARSGGRNLGPPPLRRLCDDRRPVVTACAAGGELHLRLRTGFLEGCAQVERSTSTSKQFLPTGVETQNRRSGSKLQP